MKMKLLVAAVGAAFASGIERVAKFREEFGERLIPVPYRFGQSGAVANTKSTEITNADATPPVKTHVSISHGRLHEKVATVEIAAADDNDSVYRMVRLHSSWRLSELTRYNDAITSGADFDVGFYDTADNGGAVVNINALADAVSLASASVTGVSEMYESGGDIGVEDIEQRIWEMCGLSTDPNKWLDLCYTGVAVGSGAGTLSVRVRYVAND